MDSSTSPPDSPDARRTFALWAGVLTGPIAWLCLLEVNYVLAHVACQTRSRWFLHAASATAVALVAIAGYGAWSARGSGPADHATTAPATGETRTQLDRWMRLAGLVTCAWFVVVILAMEVPLLELKECR